MWTWLHLVSAVTIPNLVTSHRYVRPLPVGTTFEGVTGNSTTSESVVKCVDAWAADPPKALVFNERTKSCTAFSKVYRTKEASVDERGYLVTVSDKDICFKNAMEDIEKIFDAKCLDGWTEISYLSTTACYIAQPEESVPAPKFTNFNVCENLHPDSKSPSIHSEEENAALVKAFPSPKNVFNIPLILVDRANFNELKAWKWVDGTELDYNNNFNPTKLPKGAKNRVRMWFFWERELGT